MLTKKNVLGSLMVMVLLCMFMLFYKALQVDPHRINSTKIGHALPNRSLISMSGKPATLAKLVKGKATLVNIWASWCMACKYEHPVWLALNKKHRLHIVGIAYKDSARSVSHWLDLYGNPYEAVLLDQDGRYSLDMGVYGTPETFLLNGSGRIVAKHIGMMTMQAWHDEFEPVLAALQNH